MAVKTMQISHLTSQIHVHVSLNLSSVLIVLININIIQNCWGSEMPECSRHNSRVARDILKEDFYPVMQAGGWAFPPSCPLQPSRDMFLSQEERKRSENANRWYCNFCGKAFTSENYLDMHFSNRHLNTILTGRDAVCLADHCDYLRCDVISGAKKASYWDKSLCRQSDLDKLKQRCEAVIKSCLPAALSGMDRHELRDKLKKVMCSSLTCERYWEAPSAERSPHGKVAYAAVTCILIVGLLLYYIVAYTHFYTDNSILRTDGDGLFSSAEDEHYNTKNPYESDIRNRYQQVSRR